MRSKPRSTVASKAAIRSAMVMNAASCKDERQRRATLTLGLPFEQRGPGEVRLPTELGAELLERAVVAERRGMRSEVVAFARGADGLHHRVRLQVDPAQALVGGRGDDA